MSHTPLILNNAPELSDEAASQFLDMLYELATAVENHYFHQLRRYHEPSIPQQPDLFEDFDDDLPEFLYLRLRRHGRRRTTYPPFCWSLKFRANRPINYRDYAQVIPLPEDATSKQDISPDSFVLIRHHSR